jgi:hypothetical protein
VRLKCDRDASFRMIRWNKDARIIDAVHTSFVLHLISVKGSLFIVLVFATRCWLLAMSNVPPTTGHHHGLIDASSVFHHTLCSRFWRSDNKKDILFLNCCFISATDFLLKAVALVIVNPHSAFHFQSRLGIS